MRVKVGQWVRYNYGKVKNGIIQYCEWHREDEIQIIKVADTPQELIQVGDLVFIKNYWEEPLVVSHIDNNGKPLANVRTSSGSERIDLTRKKITKILTPNANGGYDLQWEQTND